MGVKGALAISAALFVNTQIQSLNLGDNWLKVIERSCPLTTHTFYT